MRKNLNTFCIVLSILGIASCGSGGGSTSTVSTASSGKAVDGYISGATVTLDINDDGIFGGSDPTTTTDSSGNYSFSSSYGQHLVSVSGGTDVSSNTPFLGQLLSPAGAAVATPLTTLVVAQVLSVTPTPSASTTFASSISSANQKIATALGVSDSSSLLSTDPVAVASSSPKLLQLNSAVQTLMSKTSEAISTTITSPDTATFNSIYGKSAASLANILNTGSAVNLTDSAAALALTKSVVSSTVIKTNLANITTGLSPTSTAAFAGQAIAEQVGAISSSTAANLLTTDATLNPFIISFKNQALKVAIGAAKELLASGVEGANSADALQSLSSGVRTALASSNGAAAASLINSQIGSQSIDSVSSSALLASLNNANSTINQLISQGGKTFVSTALTGLGTIATPSVINGASNSGANKFSVTVGASSTFVKITGCTATDFISIVGLGSNPLIVNQTASDVRLTVNAGAGVVTRITFTDVVPDGILITDLSSFNALGVCTTTY